jgi:hypothetical protein
MSNPSTGKKTPANELIERTAESFHTYVGKGVNAPGIGDEATDPTLNVDDLQSLLRIHFVLTGTEQSFDGEQSDPLVVPFMKALPRRIRRLQRSTYQESELVKGGVRGTIDWGETVEMYSNRGYIDKSQFVCVQPQTEYDTAQNRVLLRLLLELKSVFETELESAVENPDAYAWLEEWVDDPGLLTTLEEILTQNIYLETLNPPAQIAQRELTAVKRSRRPLYREAAKLLDKYYDLQNRNLDLGEAGDILTNVYVRPDTDQGGRLFELYWTFRLLEQFPEHQLRVVRAGTNLIATCAVDGERYELYHHSQGPDEFDFRIRLSDVDEELTPLAGLSGGVEFFERMFAVQRDAKQYSQEALGSDMRGDLWSGVPDILLVRYDDNGAVAGIVIGECKYTRELQEIKKGIVELLEYMYYGQYDGSYLLDGGPDDGMTAEGISVDGCVFVDWLPEGTTDEDLPISLVEYGQSYDIPWLG